MSTYAGRQLHPATITIPDPESSSRATAGTVDRRVRDLAKLTTFLAARSRRTQSRGSPYGA